MSFISHFNLAGKYLVICTKMNKIIASNNNFSKESSFVYAQNNYMWSWIKDIHIGKDLCWQSVKHF